METRANHLWVGAVTLLLLAGLAAFILWLSSLSAAGQNRYDIFFKQSVEGLAKGSVVSFAGVPAGQVEDIELWPPDPQYVRVRIRVEEKVPILQGTTATLQGSFTGITTVQLSGAMRNAKPITKLGPEGVPVIPTKQGGLGALLASAPLLLERLTTLSERLAMLLSDRNQASIEGILNNTERLSGNLADSSPKIDRTLSELQATLRQANLTLASFDRLAGSADTMINSEGRSLADELRATLKSAQGAAAELQGAVGEARPAARQLNEKTLPAAEAVLRELAATTRSLRDVTDKVKNQGAGGLIGGPNLPDYEP